MARAMISPKFYAWDRDGKPLAFGKVYTYQARTNSPKPTYQSEDQIVANTNPVILNGEGYANIYLDGAYKIVVKDSNDNEIWTADPVTQGGGDGDTYSQFTLTGYYSTPTKVEVLGDYTSAILEGMRITIASLDTNGKDQGQASTVISSTFDGSRTGIVVADPVITTNIKSVSVTNWPFEEIAAIEEFVESNDRYFVTPQGQTKQTVTGIQEITVEQFNATFQAQFVYKYIGNISDFVGQSLAEADKLNAYQYPDDSDKWYGPIQSQSFPIIIPSDPSTNNGWALVNAATQGWVTDNFTYTFKSVAEMVASGAPAGTQCTTGETNWVIGGSDGLQLDNGEFANPIGSIHVIDFCVGDGLADDSSGVLDSIAAWRNVGGNLHFGSWTYNVGTSFIDFGGLNVATPQGDRLLTMSGNKANLLSSIGVGTDGFAIGNSWSGIVEGISFSGADMRLTATKTVKFRDCSFEYLKISQPGNQVGGSYWNRYVDCRILGIWVDLGQTTRYAYNANSFVGCKIWYGDFCLKITGNYELNGPLSFYDCDMSYVTETTGRIFDFADSVIGGSIDLYSCYFDTYDGAAQKLGNININTYGSTQVPSTVKLLNGRTASDASAVDYSGMLKTTSATPTSPFNYMINGSLEVAGGVTGSGGATVSYISDSSVGLNSYHAHVDLANSSQNALMQSAPAPADGYYCLTLLAASAEAVGAIGYSINGGSGQYGWFSVGEELTYSSRTVKLNKGDTVQLRIYGSGDPACYVDIGNFSLSFGRRGQLNTVLHDTAKIVGKTQYLSRVATEAGAVIASFDVGQYTYIAREVKVSAKDTAYPDGTSLANLTLLTKRGGGSAEGQLSVNYNHNFGAGAALTFSLVENPTSVDIVATTGSGDGNSDCALTITSL